MVYNGYEYDTLDSTAIGCDNYCEEVQDVIDDYERPIPMPKRKVMPRKIYKQVSRKNFTMRRVA